jgi:hypothetical protein
LGGGDADGDVDADGAEGDADSEGVGEGDTGEGEGADDDESDDDAEDSAGAASVAARHELQRRAVAAAHALTRIHSRCTRSAVKPANPLALFLAFLHPRDNPVAFTTLGRATTAAAAAGR